ncbi:MAG: family 43 glycosylhydrolase [candidate division KSB1 bacterium]|nr:family 43 glycosylhydrolase [candidate division KSB1 bacterium]MDZ7346236.1 family 43 glycosylhydrolase [candidate division KSB1 bacterium]
MMKRSIFQLLLLLTITGSALLGRSPSFLTFMNPIIPGDHPDCTLTRVGNDFYTTGSSFSTTPIIYHSTDLVHWEAISHPVDNSWPLWGTNPADGIWGGHLVFRNGKYWHFFGRAARMYFVTADRPEGPWSQPKEIECPPQVPGLGMDNSIFIDDDNSWYLLVKNGQSNNWIVQLGDDAQPTGVILNLCWINPAPTYPYSWAEGPVMWKRNGWYYYSFAIHIYATQRVMRSRTLTDDPGAWEFLGNFFNENDPKKGGSLYNLPNHCSPAVELDDGTWWVMYHSFGTEEWRGLGRQGLLSQVRYVDDKPIADFPINEPMKAPDLPSSGIPWMVPKSDFFDSEKLNPEWRRLGYCPQMNYSLTDRPGWLRLLPKNQHNTVVKNDAEHNYALITRVDFAPQAPNEEAGIRIMTGLQNLNARLFCTVDAARKPIIVFTFDKTRYEVENTVGSPVWLKIYRYNHNLTGFYSADGFYWTQIGAPIKVSTMDVQQPEYNAFTGNKQGLYVIGRQADFDLYIYRDAYSPIWAECYANQWGNSRLYTRQGSYLLDNIHNGDWAMYAGVEFGGADYPKQPDSLKIVASCVGDGGTVEVWLDSLETGRKIGECRISSTGDWKTFQTFTAPVEAAQGRHDLYLKFTGSSAGKLFQLQSFLFKAKGDTTVGVSDRNEPVLPRRYSLKAFPNPFNQSTILEYDLPKAGEVELSVFDLQGRRIRTFSAKANSPGKFRMVWDGKDQDGVPTCSGTYFCRLETGEQSLTTKLVLIR